jgi:N-acetyl-D-muramate 6-phosphate phosphatase
MLQAVLFDLDGTLADTAPDLAAALNHVLKTENRDPLPFEVIRPWVSHGARYMILKGFYSQDLPHLEELWKQLITFYQHNLAVETRLFEGMDQILRALEERHMKWGIVTNKPTYLTDPLVQALDLNCKCVVSGDTLAVKKPDPAPLLYACEQLSIDPSTTLYVGDAERDIEAGKRAGMRTAVALFGYLGAQDNPQQWGADVLLVQPIDLLKLF